MDQGRIIDALLSPSLYGLAQSEQIERIDTHISIVFLAQDKAYKLKRAIQLPFVDFRTPEARKTFCEKELVVNAPFAAGLYEEVVTLYHDPEVGFNFDNTGQAVDYLVKMARFDQEDMFDYLCDHNKLDLRDIEALTDHIYESYMDADISHDYGGASGMTRAFENHFKAFEACPQGVLDAQKISDLKEQAKGHIAIYHDLLEDRRKKGFVRSCHGDLHLRNIARFQGEVILFDAIEFEPDYGIIDVFYDLSFLLMDLCHRDRVDLANAVLNRFVGRSGDAPGLHLLGLFLASRATIRSHVSAVASQNQQDEDSRQTLEAEARLYLDEALGYFTRSKPMLIAIGGLSGSGKSHLARALAPDLGPLPGALIVRSDMIRKRLMKVHPTEKLSEYGYRPSVNTHTYNTMYVEAHFAIHAGMTVIMDGVFARPDERAKLAELAKEMDIPFVGLWLEGDKDTLKARAEARVGDASDADGAVIEKQWSYELGEIDWHKIDANRPLEDVLAEVRSKIN